MTTSDQEAIKLRRAKRPKGIVLMVVALYGAAALVVISALATGGSDVMPSDVASVVTIYLIALAFGLWRLWRWSWFATVIMFILSTFYVLSNAQLLGNSILSVEVISPLLLIVLALGYLLSKDIRTVYLRNGWEPVEEEEHRT
ncbi:hypothetical protein [Herpetosiphon geysericola]|uniref:Uncharacterized protein n=1 Tax=Herpetosiphon geysericola TaxID=70996 RepID=A0A0P6XXK1_9CHLR|nr:hypothetical protein [Herpetosiphon geysericola]KPL81268.1 hypothetical protein SE18_21560 [Herpetosiphon geysericola]